MEFIIDSRIIVKDAVQVVFDMCSSWLVVDNPDYAKKERMGLWTGSTPRKLCLFEQDGDNVILPIGCIRWLKKNFPNTPIKDYRTIGKAFNYGSKINLYPYQDGAVEAALYANGGIIVAPCGAGKTQIGLEIVARRGVKTLWLTHTQDLLNQSYERAKSVFGCTDGYGKITGGKVSIGNGVTFATVQTMAKLDLQKYKNTWGCIIVDEAHHCVGSPTQIMQFYRVLSNLSARYKYGLTATPKRADGLETAMFSLLGGVVHEVSKESVAETTCPVRVRTINSEWMPSDMAFMGDGTLNYNGLVSELTRDENRLKLVAETIMALPEGQPVLVLGNRIEYLKKLQSAVSSPGYRCQCISGTGNSKRAKEERKAALAALDSGAIDCLFATYQLAKEGLDCPHLRYVVFATPEKDPTTVQQAAGRVGRKAEGKEFGTVIDFVDMFGMYQGWAKKRKSLYKKLGFIDDNI